MVLRIWIRVSASTYSASASSALHAEVSMCAVDKRNPYSHTRQRRMHRGTAHLDRANRVHHAHGCLERLQVAVLIREHAELRPLCVPAAPVVVRVGCGGRDA